MDVGKAGGVGWSAPPSLFKSGVRYVSKMQKLLLELHEVRVRCVSSSTAKQSNMGEGQQKGDVGNHRDFPLNIAFSPKWVQRAMENQPPSGKHIPPSSDVGQKGFL